MHPQSNHHHKGKFRHKYCTFDYNDDGVVRISPCPPLHPGGTYLFLHTYTHSSLCAMFISSLNYELYVYFVFLVATFALLVWGIFFGSGSTGNETATCVLTETILRASRAYICPTGSLGAVSTSWWMDCQSVCSR